MIGDYPEVEIVYMPSGFRHHADTHPGEATGIELFMRGVDQSIGAVIRLGRLLQFNGGITFRIPYKRETDVTWDWEDYSSDTKKPVWFIKEQSSPFIFQGSLVLNILRY
jgi:hypothetical protein